MVGLRAMSLGLLGFACDSQNSRVLLQLGCFAFCLPQTDSGRCGFFCFRLLVCVWGLPWGLCLGFQHHHVLRVGSYPDVYIASERCAQGHASTRKHKQAKQASERASKPASQPASKQASQPASKQTHPRKHAHKQT